MEINPLLSATYGNITRLIHFIFSMILTYSQSRLTLYFLDLLSQEPGARSQDTPGSPDEKTEISAKYCGLD